MDQCFQTGAYRCIRRSHVPHTVNLMRKTFHTTVQISFWDSFTVLVRFNIPNLVSNSLSRLLRPLSVQISCRGLDNLPATEILMFSLLYWFFVVIIGIRYNEINITSLFDRPICDNISQTLIDITHISKKLGLCQAMCVFANNVVRVPSHTCRR